MCLELMNKEIWEKCPDNLKLRYSVGRSRINQLMLYWLIGLLGFTIMGLIFWVSGAVLYAISCWIIALWGYCKGQRQQKKLRKELIRTIFRAVVKK